STVDYFFNTASPISPEDGPPAVISNVVATPSQTGAVVTWTTDKPATSLVSYGANAGYGSSASSPGSVTSHSVTLSGLACGAGFHFAVTSVDAEEHTSTSSDASFSTLACSAVISGVSVTPSQTGATVTWSTDKPATSVVDYGPSALYGSSASDPASVTSHSVTLSGLACGSGVHFAVSSLDGDGNTPAAPDVQFSTLACSAVITNVSVTPWQTGATITWSTDKPATSVVDYG